MTKSTEPIFGDVTPLEAWRTRENLTLAQLAKGVGVTSPSAAKKYCDGRQIPNKEKMPLVVAFTNGEITPNHFYGFGHLSTPPADDTTAAE